MNAVERNAECVRSFRVKPIYTYVYEIVHVLLFYVLYRYNLESEYSSGI